MGSMTMNDIGGGVQDCCNKRASPSYELLAISYELRLNRVLDSREIN